MQHLLFFAYEFKTSPLKNIITARFDLLHSMCLQFPRIIKLWLGPNMLWIFLNDPKLIQKLLLSPVCLEKPFFYKFLRLDSGLISSKCKYLKHWISFVFCVISRVSHMNVLICELFICTSSSDDVWKLHRKSLNYSFNVKILQSFIPIFIENAQKLCADLSENLGKKQQFDMLTYTSHSALNMICGEWTKCWLTSLACWCRKRKRRKMIKR